VTTAPNNLPDEIAALTAALAAERTARQEAEARASSAEALVAHLKLLIAKLKREQYGQSSERGRRLLDQLELQLELIQPHAQNALDLLVKYIEQGAELPPDQCIPRGGAIASSPAQPGHCSSLFVPLRVGGSTFGVVIGAATGAVYDEGDDDTLSRPLSQRNFRHLLSIAHSMAKSQYKLQWITFRFISTNRRHSAYERICSATRQPPLGARQSSVPRVDRPHCGRRANRQAPVHRVVGACAGAIRPGLAGSPPWDRARHNRRASCSGSGGRHRRSTR